jgi:hypothetical protein
VVKSLCPPLAQSLKFQISNLEFVFVPKAAKKLQPQISIDNIVTHMIASARHDWLPQPGKALLG